MNTFFSFAFRDHDPYEVRDRSNVKHVDQLKPIIQAMKDMQFSDEWVLLPFCYTMMEIYYVKGVGCCKIGCFETGDTSYDNGRQTIRNMIQANFPVDSKISTVSVYFDVIPNDFCDRHKTHNFAICDVAIRTNKTWQLVPFDSINPMLRKEYYRPIGDNLFPIKPLYRGTLESICDWIHSNNHQNNPTTRYVLRHVNGSCMMNSTMKDLNFPIQSNMFPHYVYQQLCAEQALTSLLPAHLVQHIVDFAFSK